jgi:acetoin utilization protein AcuB
MDDLSYNPNIKPPHVPHDQESPVIASQLMTPNPVSVSADDTVESVNNVMRSRGFHHLLVMDGPKLAGMISDRDLLREISPFIGKLSERSQDVATLSRKAHQIMSRNLVTVPHDAMLIEVAAAMIENSISCVPVVDDEGKPVGIISYKDMLAAQYP